MKEREKLTTRDAISMHSTGRVFELREFLGDSTTSLANEQNKKVRIH